MLPRAHRAVARDPGPRERATVARTGSDEQRGRTNSNPTRVRLDRRDARTHDGDLPEPPRVFRSDEVEPGGDEGSRVGRGSDDVAWREGPWSARSPQDHARRGAGGPRERR